ncbi:MAG: hypothetical protein KBF68_01140 [Nitrosomonas sp.]|nr:hypothetical protein [Nitrosomonas sp.]MBP9099988.1 hypothetical protein [Nitrosomonas sp.]
MTTILQRIKREEHCKVPLRDGCKDTHVERGYVPVRQIPPPKADKQSGFASGARA